MIILLSQSFWLELVYSMLFETNESEQTLGEKKKVSEIIFYATE